jgi:hypothetical protein
MSNTLHGAWYFARTNRIDIEQAAISKNGYRPQNRMRDVGWDDLPRIRSAMDQSISPGKTTMRRANNCDHSGLY